MNLKLLNEEIQLFIDKHLNDEPTRLLLKKPLFTYVSNKEIVEQIISKKKCIKKLNSWFNCENIYFPNKLNLEQSSSEITAKYKSNLISGDTLVDITGGFGVDDYYFSKRFEKVCHCEINTELSNIVNHNYKQLGVKNITTINSDGLEYLKLKNQKYDWIFIDPSRRNDLNKKVFLLKDCLPNVPDNLDLLFEYSDHIMLKLSPFLDISASLNELKFTKEVHIISVNNDMKELLFILEKDYNKHIKINTINIKKNEEEVFKSFVDSNSQTTLSLPKKFLYEPNVAVLKSGLFNEVSHQLNVYKLQNNSHLYTSDNLIDFPGRRFNIINTIPYDKKLLKKTIPNLKANITTRNFTESVAQIRKKTKIKEGGDLYVFFTTNLNNKPTVILCNKVID